MASAQPVAVAVSSSPPAAAIVRLLVLAGRDCSIGSGAASASQWGCCSIIAAGSIRETICLRAERAGAFAAAASARFGRRPLAPAHTRPAKSNLNSWPTAGCSCARRLFASRGCSRPGGRASGCARSRRLKAPPAKRIRRRPKSRSGNKFGRQLNIQSQFKAESAVVGQHDAAAARLAALFSRRQLAARPSVCASVCLSVRLPVWPKADLVVIGSLRNLSAVCAWQPSSSFVRSLARSLGQQASQEVGALACQTGWQRARAQIQTRKSVACKLAANRAAATAPPSRLQWRS